MLAQIIKDNPGCNILISQSTWVVRKNVPVPDGFYHWNATDQSGWMEKQELASSQTHPYDAIFVALGQVAGVTILPCMS